MSIVLEVTKERADNIARNFHQYEQYFKLVEKVASIDKAAAKYLCSDAMDLDDFDFAGTLEQSFLWSKSPQGQVYWSALELAVEQGVD